MKTYTATGKVRKTVTIDLEQNERTATSLTLEEGTTVTIAVVSEKREGE